MTVDEYLALGENPERYELIRGVVVISLSPLFRHNRIAHLSAYQAERFAERCPGLITVSDVDLVMSSTCVYRPDVMISARRPPGRHGVTRTDASGLYKTRQPPGHASTSLPAPPPRRHRQRHKRRSRHLDGEVLARHFRRVVIRPLLQQHDDP